MGLLVGAVVVLIDPGMGVRNLTRFDIAWANEMLTEMEWADSLLRKGTLWLAFLGASLATHTPKHINIDIDYNNAIDNHKYDNNCNYNDHNYHYDYPEYNNYHFYNSYELN